MSLVEGGLLDKAFDLVSAALGLALAIAELFGLGAEFTPQATLGLIHMSVGIRLMHGECFERLACATLSNRAGLLDRVFQLATEC